MTTGDGREEPGSAPRPEARPFRGGRTAMRACLGAGAIGAALLVVGLMIDARQALFSYLVAYAYLFALVVGAIAFAMAMHAAGAVWPTAVRRFAEAVMAIVPLAALLAVPVFAGAGWLYPWMHPEAVVPEEVRRVVLHRRPYMNLPFVVARAAVCFAFLGGVSGALRCWSLRMDRPAPPDQLVALKARLRILSSLGLPLLGVLGTVAAWDWLMSLSPTWYSTMFGLNYLAGGFVAALAAISLLTVLARRAGYLPEVGASHLYALGRMMFAFLIFWAYTAYFQYMLSWIANKPTEAEWFWQRSRGAYGALGLFVVFGTFGLPFLVLVSYRIKRRARGIAGVACWLAASQYFAVHWIVSAARARPAPFSWMDAAAALCVFGFGLSFALWRQRGHLLAPLHDPAFLPALEYRSR